MITQGFVTFGWQDGCMGKSATLPTVAGSGPLGASQPVAEADNYA